MLRVLLVVLVMGGQYGVGGRVPLAPPTSPLKVLMLLPCTSKSHLYMFLPLAEALAKRGHQVTVVDNMPQGFDIENITFVPHKLNHFDTDNVNFFEIGLTYFGMLKFLPYTLYHFAGEFYDVPEIAQLYNNRHQFDVVLIDFFINEVAYPFAQGRPFISMSITGQDHLHSASIGNTLNPSYVSHSLDNLQRPMALLTRLHNFVVFNSLSLLRYIFFILPVQIQLNKRFPEVASLVDIERNQSLAFLNSHFSIFDPTRMLPNQIEMAGVHLRPARPLPQELAEFLAGDEPVVYVSFGSAFSAKCMPAHWKAQFIEGLLSLPYKVLWKFDEQVPNLPATILMKKWLPQQDILAHPNVKLFVSHGGIMGIQEAVFHSTPILAMPIWTDQHKNSHRVQNMGLGLCLEWNQMTAAIFLQKMLEVFHDPKYSRRIAEVSRQFRDQPESALERCVYWTEYVVRHKGAPHLRSPELDLNWIQFLNLDVIATFLFVFYLAYRILKLWITSLGRFLLGKRNLLTKCS